MVNASDAQRLEIEKKMTATIQGILAQVAPIASTIDANHGAALMAEISNANDTGMFSAARLAKLMVQITGPSRGVSAQFIAGASTLLDRMGAFSSQVDSELVQTYQNANVTGTLDQTKLQSLAYRQQQVESLSAAIKSSFDRSASDPTQLQRVNNALGQSTIEGMLAAFR